MLGGKLCTRFSKLNIFTKLENNDQRKRTDSKAYLQSPTKLMKQCQEIK